jgi:adenine-specific DNA-methyltransferase
MPDLRQPIQSALQAFPSQPLRIAALSLLDTLGYRSERTLILEDSKPQAFLDLVASQGGPAKFDQTKALFADWTSADILFQLSDADISRELCLFKDTTVQSSLLQSYLFFAIELKGKDYPRGALTAIARQLNRVFPMPVMLLIRHGDSTGAPALSIAVINRRRNKLHAEKDVLEKVTLIRDISLSQPHRGHLDILASFAFEKLERPQKKPINDFDTLHAAWEKIFNVELLNKNFYDELANWYFWAKKHCHFPLYDEKADKYDLFRDTDKVREHEAKNLIRLLTRTLFVWFIKERGLVPESLFSPTDLKESILKSFDPESKETNYYKAVLQNLFFATLNQTHGEREFRNERQHQNTTTLLRYESKLRSPQDFVRSLEDTTPFLNGGLFECLDRPHPTKTGPQGGRVIIYEDGFSDRKDNPLTLPDFLFFGAKRPDDLSGEHSFGIPSKKNAEVRGLIDILDSYKFTIVENTPIDQEIALDPELLGQVFENLLASYNPETKTTARKQTGSFYTPRAIVDYMVDESLKAHLERTLTTENTENTEQENQNSSSVKSVKSVVKISSSSAVRQKLDHLFTYTEERHQFSESEVTTLIAAIDTCKILDPACGSGAFPMGTLQKLVFILSKLDPDNRKWQQRQIDAASTIPDSSARDAAITAIEKDFAENADDYGRKLYLIENCLYGVDIQSIATQVSKLRFFISLIVDQHVDRKRPNFGVRPLPNLESKFVTADTLIKIEKPETDRLLGHGNLFERTEVAVLQAELKTVRHNLFSAKTPKTKEKYRARDKELREAIAAELEQNGWDSEAASNLARWDPYDQNASAPYFDPEWMFGEKNFDIVIGNPPYVSFYSRHSQGVDSEYLARLTSQASFTAEPLAGKRFHTAMFFLDRAVQLSAANGIVAFIVDMNLFEKVFAGVRQFLLKKTRIIGVVKGLSDFENVNSGQVVLSFSISSPVKEDAFLLQSGLFDVGESVSQFACLADSECRFVLPKVNNYFDGCTTLSEVGTVSTGVNIGGASDSFLTADEIDADCLPFISTTTIKARYQKVAHHGEFIKFSQRLVESINSKNRARGSKNIVVLGNVERFKGEKIFIRQSAAAIIATFDNKVSVAPYSIFVFKVKVSHSKSFPLKFVLAVLNSSVITSYALNNQIIRTGEGKQPQIRKAGLDTIPIKKPSVAETSLFEQLVTLLLFAKEEGQFTPAAFLEDLIDACVMECYFRDHMAERNLLFHDALIPHLATYDAATTKCKQQEFLTSLHSTLNAPKHPIRNQLIRLTADSPDLLAIIKEEGRV